MVDASKNVDDYRKDQSTCQGKDHRHFPFLEVYPIRQSRARGPPISINLLRDDRGNGRQAVAAPEWKSHVASWQQPSRFSCVYPHFYHHFQYCVLRRSLQLELERLHECAVPRRSLQQF